MVLAMVSAIVSTTLSATGRQVALRLQEFYQAELSWLIEGLVIATMHFTRVFDGSTAPLIHRREVKTRLELAGNW